MKTRVKKNRKIYQEIKKQIINIENVESNIQNVAIQSQLSNVDSNFFGSQKKKK